MDRKIAAGARGVLALCLLGGIETLAGCAIPRLDLGTVPETFNVGEPARAGWGIVSIDGAGDVVRFAVARPVEIALVAIEKDGRVRPLYPLREGESSRFDGGPHVVEVPWSTSWPVLASGQSPVSASTELEAMRFYNRCRYEARVTMARDQSSSAPASGAPAGTATRTGPGSPNPPLVASTMPWMAVSVDQACGATPVGGGRTATTQVYSRREGRVAVVLLVVTDTPISAEALRSRVEHLRIASPRELSTLPQRITGDTSRPVAGYYARQAATP